MASIPLPEQRRSHIPLRWMLLLSAFILFVRKTDAFLNPQFWAEDFLFLIDYEKFGLSSFLIPRGGYLHLFPRITALIAAHLDPCFQPSAYVLASLLATLLVVAMCMSPRHALPCKAWLGLCILITPHSGEVYLTPTNVQWLAAIVLPLLALQSDPTTRPQRLWDVVILFVVGLTGPFIFFSIPLFVVRAFQRRSYFSYILAGTASLIAVIQSYFLLHAPPDVEFTGRFSPLDLILTLAFRIPSQLFFGPLAGNTPGYTIATALALSLFILVGLFLFRCGGQRRVIISFLFFGIVALASSALRKRFDLWTSVGLDSGDRYFFIPSVMLLWVLGVGLVSCTLLRHRFFFLGLLILSCLFNLPRFRFTPYHDFEWYSHCPAIRRGELVEIRINPEWRFKYRRGSFETTDPL